MKTILYILIILTWLPTQLLGQTNKIVPTILDSERETRLDSLINDLLLNDPELKSLLNGGKQLNVHYLYYRSSFSTNTIFAGRKLVTTKLTLGTSFFI